MAALTIAKAMVRFAPFDRLRPLMGPAGRAAAEAPPKASRGPAAVLVRVALRRAARRLPWHSSCLVHALAGRMMLAARGVPSTVVFGVARSPDGLQAHAWLTSQGGMVCGGREAPDFTPLARFDSAGR